MQSERRASRRIWRVRSLQLSRDKILQHVRRRRGRNEQRYSGREDAADAQLWLLRLRQCDLSGNEWKNERDRGGHGLDQP